MRRHVGVKLGHTCFEQSVAVSSFTAVAGVAASSAAKAGAVNPADATTKSSERVERVFIFCALVVSKSKRAIPSVVPKAERIKEARPPSTKAQHHLGIANSEARLISFRCFRIFHRVQRRACLRRAAHNLRGDGPAGSIQECRTALGNDRVAALWGSAKRKAAPKGGFSSEYR